MRRWLAGIVVLVAVLGTGGPASAEPAAWGWPVASHRVVRPFVAPATRWAAGHRGIDLPAAEDDAVRSPMDGVVAFAGRVVDRGVVTIERDGARATLEPVVPEVAPGDVVHRGQVVGRLGTGGEHPAGVLHLGARVLRADGWGYVNPLLFLGGLHRAVLLPLSSFP